MRRPTADQQPTQSISSHLEFLAAEWAEPLVLGQLLRVRFDELLHFGVDVLRTCARKRINFVAE